MRANQLSIRVVCYYKNSVCNLTAMQANWACAKNTPHTKHALCSVVDYLKVPVQLKNLTSQLCTPLRATSPELSKKHLKLDNLCNAVNPLTTSTLPESRANTEMEHRPPQVTHSCSNLEQLLLQRVVPHCHRHALQQLCILPSPPLHPIIAPDNSSASSCRANWAYVWATSPAN